MTKSESTKNSTESTGIDEEIVHPPTAEELKEQGNQCVKNKSYLEAILHYTHAIKLTADDPILYSNRSLAFLKAKHYYHANEDAEKAIQLKPDWAKAYFRKAEVNVAAGQYDTALLSYGRALQLQPNDSNILNAAKKAASLSNHETMMEKKVPWVGAGIGIILGVLIVLVDQVFAKMPTLKHPSLMVILVFAISIIGFGIAKAYRYYTKVQMKSLLDPPIDLLEDFKKDEEDCDEPEQPANRNRYTKAQARHRFKKGKS